MRALRVKYQGLPFPRCERCLARFFAVSQDIVLELFGISRYFTEKAFRKPKPLTENFLEFVKGGGFVDSGGDFQTTFRAIFSASAA